MKNRIFLLLIVVMLLTGCNGSDQLSGSNTDTDLISSATEKRYRNGELREYNGEVLDPAVGPRDNSIKGVQYVNISSYQLRIDGLVDQPQNYKYDEVLSLPREERLYRLYCVEGWDANILWEGVLIKTLIEKANPNAEVNTVIFHSVDGYNTSLPLQEIIDNNLLLAFNANGIELPPEMGYPFIFVAEEKWGYKWARWVNRIELSSDENYKGFWESYGYNNEADLDNPFR